MDRPPVFSPAEITRFRAELAARRAPGAYEPGRWSVSPLNRRTDVVGSLPASVRLRDATLRSVETLPGVVATDGAKAEFLRGLAGSGVPEVVTAGLGGRDSTALKAEVELVKGENPDCRVVCPLMRSTADVDRAAAAGYDAVQVWVQGFGETSLIYQAPVYGRAWRGEEWRTEDTPRDRPAVLARAARLVSYARERGLHVIVPLLMVSYATEETHEEAVTLLTEAGAGELTLFDGPGAMSPEAYAHWCTSPVPWRRVSRSACIRTTPSAWRSVARSPRSAPVPPPWNCRSTATAEAPATPTWRRPRSPSSRCTA
jgi:hypothetical protein